MAAGSTSTNVPCPHIIGSTVVELSRNNRTLAPSQLARISCKNSTNNGLSIKGGDRRSSSSRSLLGVEGPSCLFVGPIESASQETLEALYRQARDAYYSGKPLIVDDMFDRVELKLRYYGSKYVVKYPRCSLRQQSTYADAEEDPAQVFALASVWLLFLGFGSSACLVPVVYTIGQAFKDALDSGFVTSGQAPVIEFFAMMNGMLVMMLGSLIGYPVASASVGALQGLWKNDLVAIKGACPNCGEEVFAFVKSNKFNYSPHKAECHVCECLLEFRTKVEVLAFLFNYVSVYIFMFTFYAQRSIARPGKRWVYGRIYLIRRRRMNIGQRWT